MTGAWETERLLETCQTDAKDFSQVAWSLPDNMTTIRFFHLGNGGLRYFQRGWIKIPYRPRVIDERLTVSHYEKYLPLYLR